MFKVSKRSSKSRIAKKEGGVPYINIKSAGNLLDTQLSMNVKDMNTALMRQCAAVLYPDIIRNGAPKESDVLKNIHSIIGSESALPPFPNISEQSGSGHASIHGKFRVAAIVAIALLAIMLMGLAIATAMGINVWELMFSWSNQQVMVSGKMQALSEQGVQYEMPDFADDEFVSLLKKYNVTANLPRLPINYVLDGVKDFSDKESMDIGGRYKRNDDIIRYDVIGGSEQLALLRMYIEKNPGEPEVIRYGDIDYLFFSNVDNNCVVYNNGSYLVNISTSLSMSTVKKWISSMNGGYKYD